MNWHQDPILLGFIKELIQEPFARHKRFHEKDLETACQEIELNFDNGGSQKESYQKTRDLLCLILSHLELCGAYEMPKGALGWVVETKSGFLEAIELFKNLKQTGVTKLAGSHWDRLIGHHLCLELEEQANILLRPILEGALPRPKSFYPLEQLSALTGALDLDTTLTKHLENLSAKKKEALNWENEISDSWLSEVDLDFIAALRCLEQFLEPEMETERAA